MTQPNDPEQDTARETPRSKGTIAVDTSRDDSLRARGTSVRPAAGTPPAGLPRPVESSLLAPGVRKALPKTSLVGRLLSYLKR
jgi:hypothetical protein